MAELTVTSEYLKELATKQDSASTEAGDAALATSKITAAVWVTHGVLSGASNSAFSDAESLRREASQNISAACHDLAAKLRAAEDAYTGVDDDLGDSLDKQVLAR